VEQTLADALAKLADGDVLLRAAGRTDSGVHARGQVVSFTMASSVAPSSPIKIMSVVRMAIWAS
jgi:tRNA pseudouridine38-40 synthase